MRTWIQDIRYGLRIFARSPGFSAIALLTLTLGIGATAAIFSVVDAVLLRELPYRDPGRLVTVYEDLSKAGFPYNTPAPGNYSDWKKETQIFEDLAALDTRTYNLTGDGSEPEKLDGAGVTYNLFSVLGVKPILGRGFLPEEDRPGGAHVAVISYGLWQRRFGGDRKLVGREILLNSEKHTVVGVMPPGFNFPVKDDNLWTPSTYSSRTLANRGSHFLLVTGRLLPGVSIAKANADLQVLAKRLGREYPVTNAGIERFFVVPLQDTYTRETRRGLIVLFAAVACILLIACANIANLLLSRASARQREIAVRAAIGASRRRLLRQLLTESALLAIAGGALGILLATWCFTFLKNLIPEDLSQSVALTLDLRMLGFATVVSLASSFLFGLAPALQISKIDLNDVLKEGGRGSTGSRKKMFRNLLVIGEVALSLMLLVGSGLLLESFSNLRGLNPGFQSDHVLTVRIMVSGSKYREFARRSEFFAQVLERVRALAGVRVAGFTSALPLTWEGGTNSFVPENVVMRPDVTYDANDRVVTPGYFEAMRMPLRRGRMFDERDGPDALPVAIINETMARKFWPNQNPIGKRFQPSFGKDTPYFTVVGVIGDVRQMRLSMLPREEMYFPYWQAKNNWMKPRDLVIRTSGDPLSLARAVRRAVWSIDPQQPLSDIATLDNVLDREVAEKRVQGMLLGSLAALALVLATIGIYGVLSYVVTERTQEIGVRVALGAAGTDIFRVVASQGLALTGIGILVGIAGSLVLTRLVSSLLFGVSATDPLTYLGAIAIFGIVAILACYVPARRAARVDPMVALRYE